VALQPRRRSQQQLVTHVGNLVTIALSAHLPTAEKELLRLSVAQTDQLLLLVPWVIQLMHHGGYIVARQLLRWLVHPGCCLLAVEKKMTLLQLQQQEPVNLLMLH
jgi:hypothetical protein